MDKEEKEARLCRILNFLSTIDKEKKLFVSTPDSYIIKCKQLMSYHELNSISCNCVYFFKEEEKKPVAYHYSNPIIFLERGKFINDTLFFFENSKYDLVLREIMILNGKQMIDNIIAKIRTNVENSFLEETLPGALAEFRKYVRR